MTKIALLTDTHAHLDMFGSDKSIASVIERARINNVTKIITVADKLESSKRAIEIAENHDEVFVAIGVHPHDASSLTHDTIKELKKLAKHPKVVAIGEIGLDYYKDYSPRPVQQAAFEQQLDLAIEVGLPVIIHDRDAHDDVLKIVSLHKPKKGVFHCFSGTVEFARTVLAMNFYISLAGPVTYKNAGQLTDVARYVPLTKLLIETDSPYLTPHPHRGRKNEPSYVRFVAEKVAELKGIDIAKVAASTQENVALLFGIK